MLRKCFIRTQSILHGSPAFSTIHVEEFRLRADKRLVMAVIVRTGKLEQPTDAELLAVTERLAHLLAVDAEHHAIVVNDAHM